MGNKKYGFVAVLFDFIIAHFLLVLLERLGLTLIDNKNLPPSLIARSRFDPSASST